MSCCHSSTVPPPAPPVPPVKSCCGGGAKAAAAELPPSGRGTEWGVLGLLVFLSGLTMNVNLVVNLDAPEGTTRWVMHGLLALGGVVAMLVGGRDLSRSAWQAAREGRIVTDQLFLAGVAASWGVSVHATLVGYGPVFYEVPILLPAIRYFGAVLLQKQQRHIEQITLEQLAGVASARVWREGAWRMEPLASLGRGDRLAVHAGEALPVDGIIRKGRAYVQSQALTGEPFPVALETGEEIRAGMIVLDAALEVEVTGEAAGSELASIGETTGRLLRDKPPFLRSVEKVVAWFLPAVLAASAATFAFWWWRVGLPAAISNSLAVVLVACPCAFGVAIPLLYRNGLTGVLRRGISPSGGGVMELLSMVKTIAFDKTGTLTVSEMKVASLEVADGIDPARVRALVGALNARSDHPVARPFWGWAAEGASLELRGWRAVPGRGVEAEARLEGKWETVRLGSAAMVREILPGAVPDGGSVRAVYLLLGSQLAATCHLCEAMRPHATEVAEKLRRDGYQLALLTGDSTVPAEVAAAYGDVRTAMRPLEKLAAIQQWEAQGKPVLFFGDGLNDASALAAATASIAVGDGAELAIRSAKARWPQPDYRALPALLREAREVSLRTRLILRVALSYNTLGMVIAALGWLHPVVATIVMLCSSATVTALAARPLHPRR